MIYGITVKSTIQIIKKIIVNLFRWWSQFLKQDYMWIWYGLLKMVTVYMINDQCRLKIKNKSLVWLGFLRNTCFSIAAAFKLQMPTGSSSLFFFSEYLICHYDFFFFFFFFFFFLDYSKLIIVIFEFLKWSLIN